MKTNPNDPAKIAFHQGYAAACANFIRLNGDEVNAREAMAQAFSSMKDLAEYGIDSIDLEVLIPLMKEHLRLERIKKERSALNETSTSKP